MEVTKLFTGKTVLVVEDEYLLGLDMVDVLEAHGAAVIGPVVTTADALAILENRNVDGALLDINLAVETSYPVADRLMRDNIAFLLVTSLAPRIVPEIYRSHIIDKMTNSLDIIKLLRRSI